MEDPVTALLGGFNVFARPTPFALQRGGGSSPGPLDTDLFLRNFMASSAVPAYIPLQFHCLSVGLLGPILLHLNRS
jgi:hypothetical protein